MGTYETFNFRLSPEQLQEKEEAKIKFDAAAGRTDLILSKYGTDKRKEEAFMADMPEKQEKLLASESLFTKNLSLPELPQELQGVGKEIQRSFVDLGKAGLIILKRLQDTQKPKLTDDDLRALFGGLSLKFAATKESILQLVHGSAMEKLAPDAVKEIQDTFKEYEDLLPAESAALFAPAQVGTEELDYRKRLNTTGRMMLVVLGGAYTLFALITGMKTKNYTPAIFGAIATAAAIFGTKRLLEGPGSRVVREMEFLDAKDCDEFFDRYAKGDEENFAQYVEAIQKSPPSFGRLNSIRKSKKTDEEKEAAIAKLFSLDSAKDSVKEKVLGMIEKEDTNDLSILVKLAEGGTHSDTKKDIVSYVRKGGRSTDMKVAKDPTKALEAEAAANPTLPS